MNGLGAWSLGVLECWGLGVLRLVTFVASLIVNFVETHGGEIDEAYDKALLSLALSMRKLYFTQSRQAR